MRLTNTIPTVLLILISTIVVAEPFNRAPFPYPVSGYYYPYPTVHTTNSSQNIAPVQPEQIKKIVESTPQQLENPPKKEPISTTLPENIMTQSGVNDTQQTAPTAHTTPVLPPPVKKVIEENNPLTQIMIADKTNELTLEPAVPAAIELTLEEKLHKSQPIIEAAIKSGNFAEAYYLWRPLAEAGAPSAQYGIGWMYHNGYGLAIDDQKAYEWWGMAASQNYVEAIFSIGTLYQFGYGVMKKDIKTALSYYLMATVAGHDESRLILQTMLDKRDDRIKPILSALLTYYFNSAMSGEDESQKILQKMLLDRDPRIEPIRPKLLNHYRDSAISGDENSQQLLRTMMLNGDPQVDDIIAELLKSHPKVIRNIPATVSVKYANTRTGPSTQYKIIKVLKQGDKIIVLDRKDGWFLVQPIDSDKRVWISAKLVILNP